MRNLQISFQNNHNSRQNSKCLIWQSEYCNLLLLISKMEIMTHNLIKEPKKLCMELVYPHTCVPTYMVPHTQNIKQNHKPRNCSQTIEQTDWFTIFLVRWTSSSSRTYQVSILQGNVIQFKRKLCIETIFLIFFIHLIIFFKQHSKKLWKLLR